MTSLFMVRNECTTQGPSLVLLFMHIPNMVVLAKIKGAGLGAGLLSKLLH